jgi:DNA (cytosine-5)-methyltransferase 1
MSDTQLELPKLLKGRPHTGVPRKEQIRRAAKKRRESLKSITLEVSSITHTEIKSAAQDSAMTMQEFVLNAITKEIMPRNNRNAKCETELDTIDLFAGCGGMSLGFQNAGFNIVKAFDNWEPSVRVYKDNFSHSIDNLDLGSEKNFNEIYRLNPNVIIGGPPCQDFSSAGRNNYKSCRANLAKSFYHIVEMSKPSFFVLENVPRIRHSELYRSIKNDFENIGYGITETILNACYCGVPQKRKRLFMIGHIGGDHNFLFDYIEGSLSKEKMTMYDYFGDGLGIEHYFRIPTNYTRRAIFSIREPSVTIRGVDRPIPKTYKKHKDDPVSVSSKVRILTVRERSYVQTFPKTFILNGTKTNLNQMIGNAVPVKLAEFLGRAILSYINNNS